MVSQYNAPVVIPVYIGSGKRAEKIRENLIKYSKGTSLSSIIMTLLKKAEPSLFKGVEDGKK